MGKIEKLNLKGHLLTAISYLIPIVCGAGFLITIGTAFGETSQGTLVQGEFFFSDALIAVGGVGLELLPVVVATGISYSIAAKPGTAPGLIIGSTANAIGAGSIRGVLGGYFSEFLVLAILSRVKIPNWAKELIPTLIIPLVASILGGLIMVCIIETPVALFMSILTNLLEGLGNSSLSIFSGVIGLLSGVNYGGPTNRTVFTSILTMRVEGIDGPIIAFRLMNMATPIGFELAYLVVKVSWKDIYTEMEVETLKPTVPTGVINIVEDVIPLVMNDIVRSVVAMAIGGFTGGAATIILDVGTTVPFDGVLMIPTMSRPWADVIAILANVFVIAVVLAIIRKDVGKKIGSVAEKEEEDIDLGDIQIS